MTVLKFQQELAKYGAYIGNRNAKPGQSVSSLREQVADNLQETARCLYQGQPGPMAKQLPNGVWSLRIGYGKNNAWFAHDLHPKSKGIMHKEPLVLAKIIEAVILPKVTGGELDDALEALLEGYRKRFKFTGACWCRVSSLGTFFRAYMST